MSNSRYAPLNVDDSTSVFRAKKFFGVSNPLPQKLPVNWGWTAALALSLMLNVIMIFGTLRGEHPVEGQELSFYAKLPHVLSMYGFTSLYGSNINTTTEKEADKLWETSYTAPGVVALKHSDATGLDLPVARDFPWDKDYGVYVVSGMYSLQCLKKLRRSIVIAHRNEAQLDDYSYLLRCADTIRQDILCHADDTPMASANADPYVQVGEGQKRLCRSWDALEKWSADHTACFANVNETSAGDEVEKFKYCPKDSRFAAKMREHFGLAQDWYEEPVEKIPDY